MATATVALEAARGQRRGQIYVALAAVAWSTAGVLQRQLTLDTLTQVPGRAAFAGAALLLYVAVVERGRVLQAFLDAFNDHDVDAIMSFFTEDCVFDTPRAQRLVGREQVRKGIQARFDGIPDIHYGDERHWTCGDRGVSEWTIRGTQVTGERIEVRGCDLFEFTDGKISRKDSFWKIVD